METYIILSHFDTETLCEPGKLPDLAERVSQEIKAECSSASWKRSYATVGKYDVIDIVETESVEDIDKITMIIRAFGHADTEVLPATPWKKLITNLRSQEQKRRQQETLGTGR